MYNYTERFYQKFTKKMSTKKPIRDNFMRIIVQNRLFHARFDGVLEILSGLFDFQSCSLNHSDISALAVF